MLTETSINIIRGLAPFARPGLTTEMSHAEKKKKKKDQILLNTYSFSP